MRYVCKDIHTNGTSIYPKKHQAHPSVWHPTLHRLPADGQSVQLPVIVWGSRRGSLRLFYRQICVHLRHHNHVGPSTSTLFATKFETVNQMGGFPRSCVGGEMLNRKSTRWCPSSLAWFITPISRVYGRYIELVTMVYKPTNITGGHLLATVLWNWPSWSVKLVVCPSLFCDLPQKGSVRHGKMGKMEVFDQDKYDARYLLLI